MSHPNQPTSVSKHGIALIKKFEGLHKVMSDGRIRSYRCPAGRWTIGYGHTKGVRSNQHITEAEAEQFLLEDIAECVTAIRKYVNVPLNQGQMDGLVGWTYNLGSGNLKSSTLLKKLNAGDYDAVPAEMMRWNKATVDGKLTVLPGLTRRRTAEAALFSLENPVGDSEPLPQKVVATSTKKPLTQSRTLVGAGLATVAATITGLTEWADTLTTVADQIWPFVETAESLKWVWLALTVAGAALAAYARIDDHNEGIN